MIRNFFGVTFGTSNLSINIVIEICSSALPELHGMADESTASDAHVPLRHTPHHTEEKFIVKKRKNTSHSVTIQ